MPEIHIDRLQICADSSRVNLAGQIATVERELAIRRSVYPRWVEAGRMKAEAATRELEAMEAVLGTLLIVREIQATTPEAIPILTSFFSILSRLDEP